MNAFNDVVYCDNGSDEDSIGFNNVANQATPANWSNPVAALGVCASYAYGTAPSLTAIVAAHVPGPSGAVLAALSAMLALLGISMVGLRRR